TDETRIKIEEERVRRPAGFLLPATSPSSCEREGPRDKPVASSGKRVVRGSSKREPPRDKPVASQSVGSAGCHGLVPWWLTFVTTATPLRLLDATGLSRG